MFELTLGRSENWKLEMYFLPGFLYVKRGVEMLQSKMARQQISKQSFLDTSSKGSTHKVLSLAFQFCARETACGPKKHCF